MKNMRPKYSAAHSTRSRAYTPVNTAANGAMCTRKKGIDVAQLRRSSSRRTWGIAIRPPLLGGWRAPPYRSVGRLRERGPATGAECHDSGYVVLAEVRGHDAWDPGLRRLPRRPPAAPPALPGRAAPRPGPRESVRP